MSSKADSNAWEIFTRSELKLESVHQESPRSDIFRKRATKPLLNQKHRQKHLTWTKEKKNWTVAQWSKVLFSDEIKCCISFGNQCSRVWRKSGEAQNPCYLKKSSVKFLQSVMIWAATEFSEVHSQRSHLPGNFRALHASFCWQASWRCGFNFPVGLGTCPHCQRSQKLVQGPWCSLIGQQTRLTWTPENLWWETPDPTMQMSRRPLSKQPGLHYTWAVPQTDCVHATLHWCSNSCKRRPNQVLSA